MLRNFICKQLKSKRLIESVDLIRQSRVNTLQNSISSIQLFETLTFCWKHKRFAFDYACFLADMINLLVP